MMTHANSDSAERSEPAPIARVGSVAGSATGRRRSWWRKDAAVMHAIYGEGVITNFVACPPNHANVYFYGGDCTRADIPRSLLKPIRPNKSG